MNSLLLDYYNFKRDTNLTLSKWQELLLAIASEGEVHLRKLSRLTSTSLEKTSKILNTFRELRLIEERKEGRRRLVKLTELGGLCAMNIHLLVVMLTTAHLEKLERE